LSKVDNIFNPKPRETKFKLIDFLDFVIWTAVRTSVEKDQESLILMQRE